METKTITDRKGREIELRYEIDGQLITAYHDEQKIGGFTFDAREGAMPDDWCLLVTHMFLDEIPGYRNCGIGTEIVRWAQELEAMPVIFGRSDGAESEDGSHLIGDGPHFAESIYRKGRKGTL